MYLGARAMTYLFLLKYQYAAPPISATAMMPPVSTLSFGTELGVCAAAIDSAVAAVFVAEPAPLVGRHAPMSCTYATAYPRLFFEPFLDFL